MMKMTKKVVPASNSVQVKAQVRYNLLNSRDKYELNELLQCCFIP